MEEVIEEEDELLLLLLVLVDVVLDEVDVVEEEEGNTNISNVELVLKTKFVDALRRLQRHQHFLFYSTVEGMC